MPLSDKHLRFVEEYVVDFNGAAAAVRAGYGKGRAKQTASELLTRDDVKAAIGERQAKTSADAGDRASRATARLEAIAFVDVGPLAEAPASMLNVSRAACVDLLKLEGKFTERVEHTGKDGGPIQINDLEAARRVAFLLTKATRPEGK